MTDATKTTYHSLTGFTTHKATHMGSIHSVFNVYDWVANKTSIPYDKYPIFVRIVQTVCIVGMMALSIRKGVRSSVVTGLVAAGSYSGGVLIGRQQQDPSFKTMEWTRFLEVRLFDFNHTGSWCALTLLSLFCSHSIALSVLAVTASQKLLKSYLGSELTPVPTSLDEVCQQAQDEEAIFSAGMTKSWLHGLVRLMQTNPTHRLSQRFVQYYNSSAYQVCLFL